VLLPNKSMHLTAHAREVSIQDLSETEVRFVSGVSPSTEVFGRALHGLAQSNAPVLIIGESGSGKRTLASEIHRISGGTIENIVPINCAEPELEWLSSDLQHAGTIVFQEISQLSGTHQLQMLQRFFGANGGNGASRPRLIAFSRHSLNEDVRSGKFREDLYCRISVFCLCLPPLRQRKEDIPILAQHFAAKFSALLGRPAEMSQRVLQLFSEYSWPGNIRELEYVVRTIVAIGDENIALAAIRASGFKGIGDHAKVESLSLKQASREASRRAERELILNALSRTHWNRKRAARDLQISYKALLYKLKQIGIDNNPSFGVQG
jgi:two-component system response regulator AtoC